MSYPTDFDSIPTVSDGSGNIIYASHHNSIKTALDGLRTALGDAPQGNLASVEARLDVVLNDDGKLKAQTGYRFVGKSGCQYSTIQSALDAASTDDVIIVFPGTYTENVTVSKRVLLFSFSGAYARYEKAIISGTFTVSSHCQINGFQFEGNISLATSGETVYFINCRQQSGSWSQDEAYAELYYCFMGNITVASFCGLKGYFSRFGNVTMGAEEPAFEAYYCTVGNVSSGSGVILLHCLGGTITVTGGAKVCWCRLTAFSGTGGSGQYNVNSSYAALSVP